MTLIQLLFNFQGRINRTKFWLGFLIFFLVNVAWYSAAAFFYLMSQRPDHETFWVVAPFVFIPVAFIGLLVALFWLLAVGTKRLHDRTKSGSWMIAFLLPERVLNISSEFVDQSAIADKYWISLALLIAASAFVVWGLVELGLMRGMTGVNRYGEDTLAPSQG
jgi:uncharacterized membrane protein YhaH (DUF805 family)